MAAEDDGDVEDLAAGHGAMRGRHAAAASDFSERNPASQSRTAPTSEPCMAQAAMVAIVQTQTDSATVCAYALPAYAYTDALNESPP